MQTSEFRKAFIHCGRQLPAEMSRSDMNCANEGERVLRHSNNAAPSALPTGPEKLRQMRSFGAVGMDYDA